MTAPNASSPTAAVSELLSVLSQRLDPLIAARLATDLGGADGLPWTTVLAELDRAKGRSPHSYSRTDLQSQLRMLTERLGGLGYPFDDRLRQVSTVANELRIMRNRWAHNDPLSDLDAVRTADHAVRLLTLLGDADGAAEAKSRRTGLLTTYATAHGIAAPAPEPDPTPVTDPGYVGRHRVPGASGAASSARKPPTLPAPDRVASDPENLQRTGAAGASTPEIPTIGTERFKYEPWEVVPVGGPEIIDALPKKDAKMQVRGVAAEIAEFEGPVSLDRLVTLTVRSFGMSRCGAKKRAQVTRQLRQLDLIIDGDDVVWPTDIDPATWREFRPSGNDLTPADRVFTDISPVEIANAWRAVTARQPDDAAVSTDKIRSSVLQIFGVKRAGSKVAAHLARAEALV